MPRNGSGIYTVPNGTFGSPVTTISSSAYDTFLGDISTEMTNSVNVQGTAPMLAPLNGGGFRIKNVGSATQPTDAATLAQAQAAVPSGSVFYFAASTPPAGFLECDGSSLSTTTYAALFAVTGYTYGGAGANFNIPDLRGRVVRGWDDGAGRDSGRVFGSAQADIVGPHSHTVGDAGHAHAITDPGHAHQINANLTRQAVGAGADALGNVGGGIGTTTVGTSISVNTAATGITIATTGSGISTETRVKNIALLPCIKT